MAASPSPGPRLNACRSIPCCPSTRCDGTPLPTEGSRCNALAEGDLPKVRGTCGLAGLDVAFPMLDQGLLDFSLRLPAAYKLKGLKLRWFFKEALRGFLPDEILAKKKQGFGLPFGVWLTRNAALMDTARDALDTLAPRGIVRPDFLRTLLRERLPEHPGYYGEMVWILMMLEQWVRTHVQRHTAP